MNKIVKLPTATVLKGILAYLFHVCLECDRAVGGDIDTVLAGVQVHAVDCACMSIREKHPKWVAGSCCEELHL